MTDSLPDPYGYVPTPPPVDQRVGTSEVVAEVVSDPARPSHWYVLTAHPDGVRHVVASARLAQQRTGTPQIVHHHRSGEDCVEACGPPPEPTPDPKPDEKAAPS